MDRERAEQDAVFRRFLVAAIALSLVTWRIAFNLGAFGQVFYEDVYAVVVASLAALVATALAPPGSSARRWWSRLLLVAPTAWFIASVAFTDSLSEADTHPALGVTGLLIGLTSFPYTLYLLARAFIPQIGEVRSVRRWVGLGVLTLAVAVTGVWVGSHNYRFMTCSDFRVSGNHQPANCLGPRK
jgi:putative Mn2+ efflux pump MntP